MIMLPQQSTIHPHSSLPSSSTQSLIASHNHFITQQQIQRYQNLINQIEDDLTEITIGKQQQLVDYQLTPNTLLNIQRNITESTISIRLDIPCSIEKSNKLCQNTQAMQKQQENAQQLLQLKKIIDEKDQIIRIQKGKWSKVTEEKEEYMRLVAQLNVKVLELETILSLYSEQISSDTEIQQQQLKHREYEDTISLIERQLQEIADKKQILVQPNTLKITRGEQTSIIQLEQQESSQTNQDCDIFLNYFGTQQLLTIQQPSKHNKQVQFQLQPPFQLLEIENKAQVSALNQQTINENNYLRTQMVQLIQQLQTLKIDYKKLNNLLIDYQIKLSNNRDFYKVKLVDLERMVKQKTKYLHDLDDEIEHTQRMLTEKTNGCQTIDQLISSYSTTIKHISNQYQEQIHKNNALKVEMDQKMQFYKGEIDKHIYLVEDLTKQLDHESKCANQVHLQLNQLKEINSDLKGVIEKLWSEIKELNQQYKDKQKQCTELKEANNNEEEKERELEDMKRIIDNMNSEVSELQKLLYQKEQQLDELRYIKNDREEQLDDYQEEKKLQLYTIQKLRESTQKANQRIKVLELQLDQSKSKLQYQQSLLQNSNNNNQYEDNGDYNIDFSLLRNKSLIEELRGMKLGDKNANFELILKLIQIIEEYTTDIDNLQNQNNQLKGLVGEYEGIIEQQLQQIKNIKGQIQRMEIEMERQTDIEPENRLGKSALNNLRNNFRKTTQSYFSPHNQNNKRKIQFDQEQNKAQFYQQLVSQLQNQRKSNISLTYKLKQAHRQLMDYEKQIFQKTQAINYLNLALIKASTSVEESDNNISRSFQQLQEQNQTLQLKLEQIYQQKDGLERNIRKILNNKNKQIETLQYQISILDNNVIPELKQSNDHYLENIGKLESDNKKLLKQIDRISRQIKSYQDKRVQKTNLTFEQIKSKKYSYLTLLYIVLRLGETLLSTNHTQSFHPQDIYLISFNEFQAESLRIKLATCGGEHDNGCFSAPECINGEQETEQSIAWNYGLILDYVWNKQPYYADQKQLQNKKVYECKGKIPESIKRLIQGLVLKDKRKRLRIEECLGIIRTQIQKNI